MFHYFVRVIVQPFASVAALSKYFIYIQTVPVFPCICRRLERHDFPFFTFIFQEWNCCLQYKLIVFFLFLQISERRGARCAESHFVRKLGNLIESKTIEAAGFQHAECRTGAACRANASAASANCSSLLLFLRYHYIAFVAGTGRRPAQPSHTVSRLFHSQFKWHEICSKTWVSLIGCIRASRSFLRKYLYRLLRGIFSLLILFLESNSYTKKISHLESEVI